MADPIEHDFQLAHTTAHHAKYFAWELTRRRAASEEDRLAQSLFDASVDLNPQQIDAELFALNNPLSKGVVLADEVGLGKTIEAALVLCQLWAERRRRLLVICPAALRKQWAQELADKFNLPAEVLDARTWHRLRDGGIYDPLDRGVNIPTKFTQTAAEGGASRELRLRQIEPEFLERMFSVEDV